MMNKTYLVYELQNNITKQKYIGMTSQTLKMRFKNGKGYKEYTKINQAIKKYGWENFKHKILFETTKLSLAEEKEKYYIKKFGTIKNGYNKQLGGMKATSYEITELHKLHSSIAHRGQHSSPNTEFKKGQLHKAHYKIIKPVICVELNKKFKSITEAEKELKISHHIWDCIKGKRKKCGGYHWKEVEEVI